MEVVSEEPQLQADIRRCIEWGSVLVRCGIYVVTTRWSGGDRVEATLRWSARGDPERVLIARKTLPPTWVQYDSLFIAHVAAEILARKIELHFES